LLFDTAFHSPFFTNLAAMQLEKFNNEITELDQLKRRHDSKQMPDLDCCHKDTGIDHNGT